MNRYKFGFDISGLILFLIIMLPNFIWFAVPAPDDVLRRESVTAVVDVIGSVFQALLIASVCIIINREKKRLRLSSLIAAVLFCIGLYYIGWAEYYTGTTAPFVILALTVPPCLAFIFFTLDRKNYIALIPAVGFTVCHLIYGTENFILR